MCVKVGKGGNMGKGRNKERRKMTEERVKSQQNSFIARRHQHYEKINQSFMPSEACRMRCAEFKNKEAATHFNGHVDKLKESTFTM
jgi:hypothetical protein